MFSFSTDVSSRVKVTSQLTWQRRTTSPAESMSSIDSAYMSSPPSPGLDNGFIDNVYDDLNGKKTTLLNILNSLIKYGFHLNGNTLGFHPQTQ